MDDPNYLPTKVHLSCQACRSPVVFEGFHWRLHFPSDDALVEQVLRGTLNRGRCPACGGPVGVLAPFLAVNEGSKQMLLVEGSAALAAIFRDDAGRPLAQRLPADRLTLCAEYDALRVAMLPWVHEHVQDLALLALTGAIVRLDRDARLKLATRLRLRLLRLVAEEVLTITLQLPDAVAASICQKMGETDLDAALRKFWPRQLAGIVVGLLQDEFAAALEAGELGQLGQRVARRLAPALVDAQVLQMCAEDCVTLDDVAGAPDTFVPAYQDHYINAVAHRLAGQPNPVEPAWADFLRLAHRAVASGRFDDRWLPAPEEAAGLVRFETLWNRSAADLAGGGAAVPDLHALMERLGHLERFHALMALAPIRPQFDPANDAAAQADALRASMLEVLARHYQLPLDAATSGEFAAVAAGQVDSLARSGQTAAASQLAQQLVARAMDAGDFASAYRVGVESVKRLGAAEAFGLAIEVLAPLVERFNQPEVTAQLGRSGAELTVGFWNEVGNLYRQVGQTDAALQAYGLSRGFLDLVEPGGRDALDAVIRANEARVYRQQRRFGEARRRLEQVLALHPDDELALHSLALLHLELGEHAEARQCMDRALRRPDLALEPMRHARLLQMRGLAWSGMGDSGAAHADLLHALDIAPADASALVTQICVSIAMALPPRGHPARERAEARLLEVVDGTVDHGASGQQRSLQATALVALGELRIADHDEAALRDFVDERLEPYLQAHDDDHLPWQLLALRGRLAALADDDAAAWGWFEPALEELDAQAPVGTEVTALLGWLRDKGRFQRAMADVAIRLMRAGAIEPSALLPVIEFGIGRSTSGKLGEDSVFTIAERVPQALQDASALHVVVFLEGEHEVQGFTLRADAPAPRLLPHARAHAADWRRVQARFVEALGYANPDDLDGLQAELHDWLDLANGLGPLLAAAATPGDTIALLPCASLTGLPLHLCPVDGDGTPLIERHPVLYSGNFGMLLARPAPVPDAADHTLVVAVAKASDRPAFAEALRAAAAAIAAAAPQAVVLAGTDAKLDAIVPALERSDSAYFLCHGAHGGQRAGFALCISDGVALPPSLLAIDSVPVLKRFTLDWTDLEAVARAPALLVSIACSSGRTLVDAGGSRLGIEQALLAKGTRSIISPLWDVDQQAALAWLLAFRAAAALPVPQRCQQAALALRERFPHWYFWSAFVPTGSLHEPISATGRGPHDDEP